MSNRTKGRRFGRDSAHRAAMMRNLARSLVEHQVIKTTLPRAKSLRGFVERLVTLAKVDSVARRREVFARIHDPVSVKKIFSELAPRFSTRPGGYTRVLRCGFRQGDVAPMAYIEFVE